MTLAAIGTGSAILAWVGLALGVVVLVAVIMFFNRVVAPAVEIRRYADDILEAGVGIARNLDGADRLTRTRELGAAVPGLATAYLEKLKGPQI